MPVRHSLSGELDGESSVGGSILTAVIVPEYGDEEECNETLQQDEKTCFKRRNIFQQTPRSFKVSMIIIHFISLVLAERKVSSCTVASLLLTFLLFLPSIQDLFENVVTYAWLTWRIYTAFISIASVFNILLELDNFMLLPYSPCMLSYFSHDEMALGRWSESNGVPDYYDYRGMVLSESMQV